MSAPYHSPSARERAEIRKRIGEVLREEELNMYQKKQKTNTNTDTDINMWPKYIIIESRNTEGDTFSKLTPFAVSKYVEHLIGNVTSVKKLRSGSLLIEAANQRQSEKALKITNFGNIALKASPHNSLNKKKGVIRCPDFRDMADDDLQKELSGQGITEVKRITTFRNGKREPTNTFILTFTTHNLPKTVKAGYLRLPVSHYIPQPLRCFKCQRYGHHKDKCRSVVACQVCSEEGHDNRECTKDPRCRNCEGSHPPNSRKCPTWEREKQVIKVKTEQNISFPEARRLCEPRNTAGSVTYAKAAAPAVSSVSKSAASTQTDLTWQKHSNSFSLIQTKETQTQTQSTHENLAPKIKRNKPGPASSKKSAPNHLATNTSATLKKTKQTSDRSKQIEPTKSQVIPKQKPEHDEFELEIINRFSDLDGDTEEGEAMDHDPADSSSGGAIQITNKTTSQR